MALRVYILTFFLAFSIVLKGQTTQSNLPKGSELTCYFFFIADCPASRTSLLEVQKVHDSYENNGVKVIGVVSDPNLDIEKLNKAMAELNSTIEVVLDTLLRVANHHGASVTPEVFLYGPNDSLLYSGKADNYYHSLGKHRRAITKEYLKIAIVEQQNGLQISTPRTEPIGCKINYAFLR